MKKRDQQTRCEFPASSALIPFVIILFAAGCVRFEPKPLSPSVTAARLEDRSLTNDALKIFLGKNLGRELTAWPPASWDFEMLTLVAFYWNPNLEIARAQFAVAQAAERTAGQRPNPTLTVTPGYNSTTPMASPWFPLGFLDVPLETAGKRGHRRTHAAHLSQAARLNIITTAWQLRSTLRSHLLDFDAAGQREVLLRKQIEFQEQIVKAMEQQAQAGAIAVSELFPVRISSIKLHFDLSDAVHTRTEARSRVAEDLGISTRALSDFKYALPPDEAEAIANLTLDKFRGAALQNRADILGALAEYAAAQSGLQLEIAKQYPDIHLQPGYQFDQGDNKWSLGLLVELPVFNQNQGPIAEAKARREEAAARFVAVQSKVLAEIDAAAEVLRVTQQTVGELHTLADTQAQRRDAVAAQFKAGAIERLDLLNAESEYAAAQLIQIDGKLRYHQAIWAMENALQPPFNLPVALFQPPAGTH